MNPNSYTKEEVNFLRRSYSLLTLPELAESFYLYFGKAKKPTALKSKCKTEGIRRGRNASHTKGHSFIFTREQVDFIKQNYSLFSRKELTEELNKKFNTSFKVSQIKTFTSNHGIKSGRTGHFEKGGKSWNKGIKFPSRGRSKETQFKKGHVPKNHKPIGFERICPKDGFILIKINEVNPYTGFQGRFVVKHRWLWEQEHGPIPKSCVIRFIDGNQLNCVLENLEMVSRSQHVRMNQINVNTLPEEHREAAKTLAKIMERRGKLKREMSND